LFSSGRIFNLVREVQLYKEKQSSARIILVKRVSGNVPNAANISVLVVTMDEMIL